jgi:spore coat protein A
MTNRRDFLKTGALAGLGWTLQGCDNTLDAVIGTESDTRSPQASPPLQKYLDPLPIPPLIPQTAPNTYVISMSQFTQRLHRALPPTKVWGYGGSYPGATIVAQRDVPTTVTWINDLPTTGHILPVDFAIN